MYNNKDFNERYKDLCGRLVCWLGESEEGAELYATLHTIIGMTDDEICEIGFTSLAPYFTEHQDDDYDENISRERDEFLAGCLKPGDEVLFVATIPYGGEGDFALRGGIIRAVDADNRMCSVKGEFSRWTMSHCIMFSENTILKSSKNITVSKMLSRCLANILLWHRNTCAKRKKHGSRNAIPI